jgi:hypothetical protein
MGSVKRCFLLLAWVAVCLFHVVCPHQRRRCCNCRLAVASITVLKFCTYHSGSVFVIPLCMM